MNTTRRVQVFCATSPYHVTEKTIVGVRPPTLLPAPSQNLISTKQLLTKHVLKNKKEIQTFPE